MVEDLIRHIRQSREDITLASDQIHRAVGEFRAILPQLQPYWRQRFLNLEWEVLYRPQIHQGDPGDESWQNHCPYPAPWTRSQ